MAFVRDPTRQPTNTGRVQYFGRLYAGYGLQLISSREYQALSDELKRKSLNALNDEAKRLVGAGEEQYAPAALNPNAVTSAARESLQRRQEKQKQQRR